ncbi:MAG: trypsin-like peptidase domain-containing protein [Actinomycetota bacterium]|nr:trypsin-like peptidase domain-containing protein [Actinomycetota bacterium]
MATGEFPRAGGPSGAGVGQPWSSPPRLPEPRPPEPDEEPPPEDPFRQPVADGPAAGEREAGQPLADQPQATPEPVIEEPLPERLPEQPLPEQPLPEQPLPDEPIPEEPIPEEPLPEEPLPTRAQTPPEPAIEDPLPEEAPAGETLPDEQFSDEPLSDGPQTALEPLPVLSEPARLRERLLPRSVLGISALILAFAVGAAFSGAVLYSYYEFKKDTTEKRVASFIEGFDERFDTALATIDAETNNARAEIQEELEPLRKTRAEGQVLENLIKKVQPSSFFVTSVDEAGQPSVGSAFAVASDDKQTLLVTSYTTVKAATRQPGPPVRVRQGGAEIKSTLWTWDESKDLALIVLARGGVPALAFGPEQVRPGERVFAVSALGGAGGSATQGFVADVSAEGLQHDAAVGQAFQGGPLVNSEGGVLAVSSRSYAPLGFSSDQVFFAPFVRAACERILRCSGGAPGPGDRGAPIRR